MVGVRRTNSCETCRKRRVKCDEVRPVCGPCSKKGRDCTESPPVPFVWVKSGQQRPPQLGCIAEEASADDQTPGLPEISLSQALGKCNISKSMSLVTATKADNGSVYHKYRFRSTASGRRPRNTKSDSGSSRQIPRGPGVTTVDRLRMGFVSAYDNPPLGWRLSGISFHWTSIPRNLGRSKAMDHAVECLVLTHSSFIRGQPGDRIHGQSYMKALESLQGALNDPAQGATSSTMCAISMLSYVELLGRKGVISNYIAHSGGLAAFVRAAGRECAMDDLGKAMVSSSIGALIVDAFIQGTPCFLSEPKWHWLLDRRTGLYFIKEVMNLLLVGLSKIPGLVADKRQLFSGEESPHTAADLFWRGLKIREDIYNAKEALDELVGWNNPDDPLVTEQPPSSSTSPMPKQYWFRDMFTSQAVLYCWTMVMHINTILNRLHIFLASAHAQIWSDAYAAQVHAECCEYCERICMSTEYVKQFMPLGSSFIAYPIAVAWIYVPEDYKPWLFDELEEMTGSTTNFVHPAAMELFLERFIG